MANIEQIVHALKNIDENDLEYPTIMLDFEDYSNALLYYLATQIDETRDINATNGVGITALMAASAAGLIEIVTMLLNAGADVNAQDCSGYSALIFACQCANLEVVKLLIESGADIFLVTVSGSNALLWSVIYSPNLEITQMLLETASQQDKEKKFTQAVVRVNDGSCELIFVPQDTKIRLNAALLHMFSERVPVVTMQMDREFMMFLMKHDGFNKKRSNDGGIGGIMLNHAVVKGYEDVVRMLLDLGADVNNDDFYGAPPLILAIECNNIDLVKILLEADADITQGVSFYKTPLLCALRKNNKEIIELLLQHYMKVKKKRWIDRMLVWFI